ncbi:MAG: tRNA (uridine(54)-C5)-methyltransferase TrmA [Endozoicomonas sp.]
MSIAVVQPEQYEKQFAEKAIQVRSHFAQFQVPELELFRSKPEYYRMRAEFHIWHEGDRCYYCMFNPETKKRFKVTDFPSGTETINHLMMPLLDTISTSKHMKRKLFQVEFLTTQTGEALVSLIYHRQLSDEWQQEAKALQDKFGVKVIGRARKQKLVLTEDFVTEALTVNSETFHYTQVENSFTQPNAGINEQMLTWTSNISQAITATEPSDLLELYCGNGNFTCVLARQFNQVLATEISKSSVNSALENFYLNAIENTKIVRLSSEEFTQAMNKEREFRRLRDKDIDLDSYNISTILVDPPRAGLDEGTEKLLQRFDNILYISCNPETLHKNLSTICQSHLIEKWALFDQFPYTHHAEVGIYLKRK